jgi:hypothetical protein
MLTTMIPHPRLEVKSTESNPLKNPSGRYARLAAYDERVDRLGLDCLTQEESEDYVFLQRWWWNNLTNGGEA